MKDNREIAYIKHPVSKEEKEKLMREGKKIIDIRFMPEELKQKAKQPKPKVVK